MPVVGILGGIGSGKSSIIRAVTGLKLQIIDADRIGHELLQDQDIRSEIRSAFGSEVFSGPQTVDRTQLARRVFGESPQHEEALQQLNRILHPEIRREIRSQILSASGDSDAVVLDAALLLEGGWDTTCDWLIYIDTPLVIRQQRVRDHRGWSDSELARRESRQWSTDLKKQRADFIVDNSGSKEEAAAQMKKILVSILRPDIEEQKTSPSA